MPVVFDMPVFCHLVKPHTPSQSCRVINSSTPAQFSAAFTSAVISKGSLGFHPVVEAHSSHFNFTCKTVLDAVVPLKIRSSRPRPDLLTNYATRAARHQCRRAEQKWKKDRCLSKYLGTAGIFISQLLELQKNKYFSDIVVSNTNNPRPFFLNY